MAGRWRYAAAGPGQKGRLFFLYSLAHPLQPTDLQQLAQTAFGEPDQNQQQQKQAFLAGAQGAQATPAVFGPTAPLSPYVIRTGATIPMVTLQGINSDLPGEVTAQVSQHVYDTPTGRHLLIPQGTRLYGRYDSRVTFGQDRVLVIWNRLIYPDGAAVELGGMAGSDQGGYAGLADQVDHHYGRIFGSALLLSFVAAGVEVAADSDEDDDDDADTARQAVVRQMSQTTDAVLRKNLNLQPTITIRTGQIGSVIVNQDLYLEPWRS